MRFVIRTIVLLATALASATALTQEQSILGNYFVIYKDKDVVKGAFSISITDTTPFSHAGVVVQSSGPSCYIALRFIGSEEDTYIFEGYKPESRIDGVIEDAGLCKSHDMSLVTLTFKDRKIEFYIKRSGYGEYRASASRR